MKALMPYPLSANRDHKMVRPNLHFVMKIWKKRVHVALWHLFYKGFWNLNGTEFSRRGRECGGCVTASSWRLFRPEVFSSHFRLPACTQKLGHLAPLWGWRAARRWQKTLKWASSQDWRLKTQAATKIVLEAATTARTTKTTTDLTLSVAEALEEWPWTHILDFRPSARRSTRAAAYRVSFDRKGPTLRLRAQRCAIIRC